MCICLFVYIQVLIKPKPVFQAAVVSEQARQLVTETLQQVTRTTDISHGQMSGSDGSVKDESGGAAGDGPHGSAQGTFLFFNQHESAESHLMSRYCHRSPEPQPVVHVLSSREQDWTEQEVAVESSPTIIYQEVSAGESQSATSTIKALLELQQTTGELLPVCLRSFFHTCRTRLTRRGKNPHKWYQIKTHMKSL